MLTSQHEHYLASLPDDWPSAPIETLGRITAGGTPSRTQPRFWNGDIPWVTPTEMTALDGKCVRETNESITEAGLHGSAAVLLPVGSLLVTTRATIGAVAVAAMPVATNQGFKNIVPNGSTDPDFYYHLLRYIAPEMSRLASGSTFNEISRRDFASISTPRPLRAEQRRVAAILDTADEAIAKTEALITKLKWMKAGLLHDLLTRGLDDNGQLRDPDCHPEQFKDSPLGRIPADWQVTRLGDLVVGGIVNGLFKKPELVGEGCRLVNVLDLYQDFGVQLDRVERVRATLEEQTRYEVEPGDLFFTRSSLNLSGIAHCNIVRQLPEPAVFECHLMRVRPDQRNVIPEFLGHWCRSPIADRFFKQRAKQVTMTTISQSDLTPLPVSLASLTEQRTIVEVADAHDARIRAEEAYRDKLTRIKKGLMHDLLTGRVRVTVNEELVAESKPVQEALA